MTLDGTRTYIIGQARVAIVDPGPAIPSHLNAIVDAVGDGVVAAILLTHGHPDHAEGVDALRALLRPSRTDPDPDTFTDTGRLQRVPTPGHTPDHVSYWLPGARALFCGDLMMGGLNTALVAPPEGNLGDYLASLERLRSLEPAIIYPSHGPPFTEPAAALEDYIRHRREREQQVLAGLAEGPRDADQLTALVYGESVPAALQPYARAAIEAYIEHLQASGVIGPHPRGYVLRTQRLNG